MPMSESEGTEVTGGVTALGAEVIVYSQVCAHRELIADPSATAMPRRPERLQMLKFANIFQSLVYILEYPHCNKANKNSFIGNI